MKKLEDLLVKKLENVLEESKNKQLEYYLMEQDNTKKLLVENGDKVLNGMIVLGTLSGISIIIQILSGFYGKGDAPPPSSVNST